MAARNLLVLVSPGNMNLACRLLLLLFGVSTIFEEQTFSIFFSLIKPSLHSEYLRLCIPPLGVFTFAFCWKKNFELTALGLPIALILMAGLALGAMNLVEFSCRPVLKCLVCCCF